MTTLRAAATGDLAAIHALLDTAGLPAGDVADHLAHFVVAEDGAQVVGVGGLEACGSYGLIRSFAVAADYRGQGIARSLFERLWEHAGELGVEALYLLTTGAADYFARLGFAVVAREQAPEAIRDTRQFASLCPASAVLMRRPLRPGAGGGDKDTQDTPEHYATALFDAGYYCAESVLMAVARARGLSSPDIPAMATGFCSGMARTSGMCGALTGGVLALNLVHGRRQAHLPAERNYAAVRHLIDDFRSRFGATDCSELLGYDLGTPEGQRAFREQGLRGRCRTYTAAAARTATELARR
jgi:C_GCAxxG_C_C family probable redox protein